MRNRVSKFVLGFAATGVLVACGGDVEETADTMVLNDTAPAVVDVAPAPATGAFLDPNAASAQELQAVPNLSGPAADALVAGRPYADMTAVDRVLAANNLTEEQRDSVYTRVWRPIDPNTASDAEIMLIPGVGERMAHEFEEYRPWTSVDQFRREIGKYVDEAEVARLESYITIQ